MAIIAPVRIAKPAATRSSRAVAAPSSRHGRWTTSSPADEEADAEPRRRREPLAEHDDAEGHREQRGGAAGERIHDRQVAPPVGRGEEHEVRDLDRARDRPDQPRLGRDRRLAEREPAERHERDEDQARRHDSRGRRAQRVAGGLEQDVPRRVQDGGDGDRDERGGVHDGESRSWRVTPPDANGAGRVPGAACFDERVSAGRRAGSRPRSRAGARRRRSPRAGPSRASPTRPTIGWPRCAVSASCWIQSGSSSAGTTVSMTNVRITSRAMSSPANAVVTRPPNAIPIPASASAYSPSTSVPTIGVATSDPPALTDPIPIATMITSVMNGDRRVQAEPAAERPCRARHGRRQEDLEPAVGLVRRPAA